MHCAAARRGGHTEVPTDMTSELCRLNQSFLENLTRILRGWWVVWGSNPGPTG